MIKIFIAFIFAFGLFQTVQAQKDSVLLYINDKGHFKKDFGKVMKTKDSADYLLLIKMPADSSSGVKVNAIKELTIDNKPILTGTAKINLYDNYIDLNFVGSSINFYSNGKQKSIVNYSNNKEIGELTEYYPNGHLYSIKRHKKGDGLYLIECYDSIGNVLSKKGAGNWVKYDNDYKNKIEIGDIKDSLEEGEWQGLINDSVKYTRIYYKGNIIPTADTTERLYIADRLPEFNGGSEALNKFLSGHIKYPPEAKERQAQERIYVGFVIEKDGSLTNIKVLKGNDASLKNEAMRIVKLLPPWQPGILNGKPVRVQYTIPITFKLAN